MESRCISENRSYADKGNGDDAAANGLSEVVVLGDLIWVSLCGSSWWPAQVVDENTVSQSNRPKNKSAGEILVRLYGSYKYMYVNPMKCRKEFEKILEQNNGNHSEILKKTLEQDVDRPKSSRAKKGIGSKSEGKSQEITARRIKVMQSLGLVAPSGSPYHRKGHIHPNLPLCS